MRTCRKRKIEERIEKELREGEGKEEKSGDRLKIQEADRTD